MPYFNRSSKMGLHDCEQHDCGLQRELYIVEGDSASKAVCGLRNPDFQAVLPMQGKPVNALKASARVLRENALFGQLRTALGYAHGEYAAHGANIAVQACRYHKIILLFDPDADGIHCGALMLIYFHHQLRPLLEAGRIAVVRTPLYEVTYSKLLVANAPRESVYAYTDRELQRVQRELTLAGAMQLKTHRTRGLGGMRTELLRSTAIDPTTRHLFPQTCADAVAAIAVFCG